jgi:NADPH:quinone reductase-like Zn-dependent oxidoreductase
MKAVVINEFGGPEKLQLVEVARPQPGDNEVLIKVHAVGLNPVDAKIRAGKHISCENLELPAILGKDMSGVIAAVGKDVKGFRKGDAVFGCISQTYAEYVVASPELIVKKSDNVSFEEAAAAPLAALTAYQAINEQLMVFPGQKVLIQSAAGGVGHLAAQFAKLNMAVVSGTASGKNIEFLRELGVDVPINYKKEKFGDLLSDLDAVLDTMGGEVLYHSILCVRPGGRVVCLPSSTKDDPMAIALAKQVGVTLIWFMMEPKKSTLELISGLITASHLKVEVDKVFPIEEIVQAHEAIESQSTRGKIVVRF